MITSTTVSRLMWIVYGIEVWAIITNRSMAFTRTLVKKKRRKKEKRKKKKRKKGIYKNICGTAIPMQL